MGFFLDILNQYIFSGVPSNAAYDLLKHTVEKVKARSWEQIYLDSFEAAVNDMRPQLAVYAKDSLVELDRQQLFKALHQDLGTSVDSLPFSRLSDETFSLQLARSMSERSVLIINNHNLSIDDYHQLIRNLVRHATSNFKTVITEDEQAFRRELMSEANLTQKSLVQLQVYLANNFNTNSIKLDIIEQKIDELHRITLNTLNKDNPPNYTNKIIYLIEVRSEEITEKSPLLVGLLIDTSRSVFSALENTGQSSRASQGRFIQAINVLIEKASFYCKTPEAEIILPRLSLFAYGYGFGKLRSKIGNALSFIGIKNQHSPTESTPSEPIRDLFAELAVKEKLPVTPNIAELNLHWMTYRKSVEAQLTDTGIGPSMLVGALKAIYQRFQIELSNPYYKYPVLLFISDGQISDGLAKEGQDVINELRKLGVQIACAYVGAFNIVEPKRFYNFPEKSWPEGAIILHNYASTITEENPITYKIAEAAKDSGWEVPEKSKLFIQSNQSTMLEDLIDFILKSLQD